MLEVFLKKNTYLKLNLFRFIYLSQITTTTLILDDFTISRSQLKRAISELNADLLASFPHQHIKIVQNEFYEYSFLNTKAENINFPQAFNYLKFYYLKNSSVFQLLNYIFISPPSTIKELSDALYSSQSYIYKTIQNLNNFMSPNKIKIETNENYQFEVIGNESHIRAFMFNFFVNSYRDIEWPEGLILDTKITQASKMFFGNGHEDIYPTQQKRLQFIFAVIDNRLRKGKSILPLPKDTQEIFQILENFQDLSSVISFYQYEYPLNEETIKREKLYFNFICRGFTQFNEYYLKKTRSSLLHAIHSLENNLFVKLSEKIAKDYTTTFRFIDHDDDLFYFCLFLLLFNSQFTIENNLLLNINRGHASENIYDQEEDYLYTQKYLLQELKELASDFSKIGITNLEKNALDLSLIFYVVYKKKTKKVLHIFIDYNRNILGKTVCTNLISKLFNPNFIQLVDSTNDADIVITDSIGTHDPSKNYFFAEDIFDKKTFNELAAFLLKEALHLEYEV